jgi:hypothetical protein
MMDSGVLEHVLGIILAFSGAGAFIDFYIGRDGQQRVKDWLQTWWIRLSYVRWGHFGSEEALFAVQVMDHMFGRRLLSLRRLQAVLAAAGISIVVGALCSYLFPVQNSPLITSSFVGVFICSVILFSLSVSLTRAMSVGLASLITYRPAFNLVGFIILTLVQYVLLCSWAPLLQYVIAYFIVYKFSLPALLYQLRIWAAFIVVGSLAVLDHPAIFVQQLRIYTTSFGPEYGINEFEARVFYTMALLPNLGRLLLALIFLGSFLLQPIQRPLLTLWARIVESDKPVFTLMFGGAAAFAQAIQQIAKNL